VAYGIGEGAGRVVQPAIAAISATVVVNCIPYLATFISFIVNYQFQWFYFDYEAASQIVVVAFCGNDIFEG
jgi:hypothetical protein